MRRLTLPVLLVAALSAGCTSSDGDRRVQQVDYAPARPVAVTLDTLKDKGPVTVGLVVTGTGARGEGGEHLGPAAGARLAQFRLGGAQRLVLRVEDDRGTAEGAAAAVDRLLKARVAGIVYASSGPHLDAAVQRAAAAGTAVLLPYETRAAVRGTGVWRTGPSGRQVAATLKALLAARGERAPFVLTADGAADELAEGVPAARRSRLGVGSELLDNATRAAAAVTAGRADAVVVAGSSVREAEAVAALQEHDASAPVVLGPAALSPLFSARLSGLASDGAATVAGQYFTAGESATDTSTSDGVAGFLAALRLAAQDPTVTALRGRKTFSQDGGAQADTRSHDAVLALVTAASRAGATTPAAVRKALGSLRVGAEQGLAGAPLDLRRADAVADRDVVALQASTRGAALRGGVQEAAPALQWFVVPVDSR